MNGENAERYDPEENCVKQPGTSHNRVTILLCVILCFSVRGRNKHKLLWKPGLYYHLIVCTELNGLGSYAIPEPCSFVLTVLNKLFCLPICFSTKRGSVLSLNFFFKCLFVHFKIYFNTLFS